MASIVCPLAFIDRLLLPVQQSAPATAFAFQVLARVDVARNLIEHTPIITLLVSFPVSLIDTAVEVDDLSYTFFDELIMLAIVEVPARVEQLANAADKAIFKLALVYDAISEQQPPKPVGLIIFEGPDIDVAIGEPHLPILTHIVLPRAHVLATVIPDDRAVTLSLSSLPIAFVGGFNIF